MDYATKNSASPPLKAAMREYIETQLSPKQKAALNKRARKADKRFTEVLAGGWDANIAWWERGPIEHPNRTSLTRDEIRQRTQEKKEQ